jgi:hypothetical protein
MSLKRKTELRRIIEEARNELGEIEYADNIKTCKKMVGRFFKEEDRYSCDDDRWYVYTKITGVDSEGDSLLAMCFFTDCYGRTEIHYGDHLALAHVQRMSEISPMEFDEAWSAVKRLVNLSEPT